MLGPQNGKLVPCARKPKTHSWHPENEVCRDCPPLVLAPPEPPPFVWHEYDPFGYPLDSD